MIEKRCIFHVPNYLPAVGASGSGIRPWKMLNAFKELGYHVDYVMGYGRQRKAQIKEIENNIKIGMKYEFLYSESSTMPTLLTEKNHLPQYPTLDFGFFEYCRKYGIKIGLYYRDIQWKFDIYKNAVPWYKKIISIPMYRYDLYRYRKLIDKFYLPSSAVAAYLKEYPDLLSKMEILPPGCENVEALDMKRTFRKPLKIFYVGGISRIYDISLFLKAISQIPDVELVLCCKEKEWLDNKHLCEKYVTPRINIVHEMGEGLKKYYRWADLCCAFAGKGKYMSMAMPIKVFEYLGNLKPIIGTADTEAGRFIEKNNIGWAVEYKEDALKKCIENIMRHPMILDEMKDSMIRVREENLWTVRAQKVVSDLST